MNKLGITHKEDEVIMEVTCICAESPEKKKIKEVIRITVK